MDLEQAFLADVVANPHDPTPWFVFADHFAAPPPRELYPSGRMMGSRARRIAEWISAAAGSCKEVVTPRYDSARGGIGPPIGGAMFPPVGRCGSMRGASPRAAVA